jgi:hypothetical protein
MHACWDNHHGGKHERLRHAGCGLEAATALSELRLNHAIRLQGPSLPQKQEIHAARP